MLQLPYFSGRDLTVVEADESVQSAISTLVELSRSSIDLASGQLFSILEALEKVCGNSLSGMQGADPYILSNALVIWIADCTSRYYSPSYLC
jgi:hypothetical protein